MKTKKSWELVDVFCFDNSHLGLRSPLVEAEENNEEGSVAMSYATLKAVGFGTISFSNLVVPPWIVSWSVLSR